MRPPRWISLQIITKATQIDDHGTHYLVSKHERNFNTAASQNRPKWAQLTVLRPYNTEMISYEPVRSCLYIEGWGRAEAFLGRSWGVLGACLGFISVLHLSPMP